MTRREKLFQPDGNGPDDRLVYVTYPEVEKAELAHERKDGGAWESVGLVELYHGSPIRRGTCADSPVLVWSWIHYHAAGDRTKHEHRVTAQTDGSAFVLVHEERTECVLGEGRRDYHDWQERDRWKVTASGVEA